MRRANIGLLWLIGVAGCGGGSPTGPNPHDPVALFDAVWRDFDRHYAYFEHGGIDWTALGDAYRDSITPTTSERESARLIGAMIGRLDDYHSALFTPFGVFGPPPISYAHHFDLRLVSPRYVPSLASTSSGRIRYGRIDAEIGYVRIPSFEGSGWGAEIDDALAGPGEMGGLIIDIRDNGGGNENIASAVAQRFTDTRRTYRVSRWRDGPEHDDFGPPVTFSVSPGGGRRFVGPIALITNRFNGSASEDFVCMMRVLPHVVTVGDTTLGLGSNPLRRQLRDGWAYQISQSTQETPSGFVYQWKGLPPTIAVAWSVADTAAGRDPYVEAALAHLRAPSASTRVVRR
jgi:carboxyl-terminal processing protease